MTGKRSNRLPRLWLHISEPFTMESLEIMSKDVMVPVRRSHCVEKVSGCMVVVATAGETTSP